MTVKDLAKIAGVNHSTVSRALNDSPRVQESTRERIKELARKYNFQFDSNARSLSSRKTGIIGIIYPADMEDFNSSLYTSRLFMDLRKKLESYQLDGILLEARHPDTGESNVERLIRQNKVDGFLVIHSHLRREDYLLMNNWDLPAVQVHLPALNYPSDELDFFFTDNRKGGRLAASHLAGSGCRNFYNITFICESDTHLSGCKDDEKKESDCSFSESEERTTGFLEELKETGVTPASIKTVNMDGSFVSTRSWVKSNINIFNPGDGLFFHSDMMAFGALSAFIEEGFRIPEDIKIIGFDDSPIGSMMEKGITTVHQPREEMAEKAAERINELVNGFIDEKNETRRQEFLEPFLHLKDTA